eukprot:2713999-Ditylum_brightwellii.AAC.2
MVDISKIAVSLQQHMDHQGVQYFIPEYSEQLPLQGLHVEVCNHQLCGVEVNDEFSSRDALHYKEVMDADVLHLFST